MINLDNYSFILKFKNCEISNHKIYNTISTVKYDICKSNHVSFGLLDSESKDFQPILINIPNKSFEELCSDKILGLRYFEDKKILLIPTIIDDVLDDNKDNYYNTVVSLYNLSDNNMFNYNIPKKLPETFPIISNAKISVIERKYHSSLENNIYILFDNLPQSLYNNVLIDEQGIMFDIDKNEYCTKTLQQSELFEKIKFIASNGFSNPLEMLIKNDGTLLPIDCEEDFLIAMYLNLPSIPVAFISSNYENNLFIKKYQSNINKEKLQNILSPYFIL